MKGTILYFSAFLFALTAISCSKGKKSIDFPATDTYGQNLLAMEDGDDLSKQTSYSFSAVLGSKANLKVVFTNLSEEIDGQPQAVWAYSEGDGWVTSDYESNTQTFESNDDGKIIQEITFLFSPGSFRMDVYENSSSVTSSKTMTW